MAATASTPKSPIPQACRLCWKKPARPPEETVIIGDSDIDVLTARNSGIYSVGVTYGLAPHTLQDAPPDVLIDHPNELALVLGSREQCRLEFQAD